MEGAVVGWGMWEGDGEREKRKENGVVERKRGSKGKVGSGVGYQGIGL